MLRTSTGLSLILLLRNCLAQPLFFNLVDHEAPISYKSSAFYEKIAIIALLVFLGGVFAGNKEKNHIFLCPNNSLLIIIGLTIGLMGLDQTNLHVLIETGSPSEQKNAKKVLALLDRGKHWVLVTLLLSNVIINETLPIILDGVLSGGWQAIVTSTALIVIFGE
jgi:hypothetical protein